MSPLPEGVIMDFFSKWNHKSVVMLVLAFGVLSNPVLAYAEQISQAIRITVDTNEAAKDSQKKIDKLDEQTKQMLEAYRAAIKETESSRIYNTHLKELIASQEEEAHSLEKQMRDIEQTQRKIVPLMYRMIDTLEQFVDLDVPFLPKERAERIKKLRERMRRADISISEKYRQVLEAYQVENDYGRTIEAYRSELKMNGGTRVVDFLRIGRVALFCQTLDSYECRYWDREFGSWKVLPGSYRYALQKGLQIARKRAAPDLLTLPVPAPKDMR
jgi:septal ring factor EnvC (AmiA/AmiB activator)